MECLTKVKGQEKSNLDAGNSQLPHNLVSYSRHLFPLREISDFDVFGMQLSK